MVDNFLFFLDVLGCLAFALSGGIAAKRKKMDGFGIIFLANITTFGGGLIRDVLLNSKPVAIFDTPRYVIIATVAGLLVRYFDHQRVERQTLLITIFDSCGLAVFTASGTIRAMEMGAPLHGVLIMGMITGSGGGIIRDLLRNEPPLVLYGDFYARASILGSLLLFGLSMLGLPSVVAIVSCVALVLAIRLYVIFRDPIHQEHVKKHFRPVKKQRRR